MRLHVHLHPRVSRDMGPIYVLLTRLASAASGEVLPTKAGHPTPMPTLRFHPLMGRWYLGTCIQGLRRASV